MKTFNLFLAVCFVFCISSCQEESYSCDPEVNKWVNSNLKEIKIMTRSEWQNLDEKVKSGCFVAFSQQQKIDFWNSKLNETLGLNWSDQEAQHIELMIRFINEHPEYFDFSREKTDEEIEVFELFTYAWKQKAEKQLGWSKTLIGGIIATGNRLLDKKGTIQITPSIAMTKLDGESNCNCSTSSDWCSGSVDCESSSCDESNHGCGTLLVYSCDGRCNGI